MGSTTIPNEIAALEAKLKAAMLASDVVVLDYLLSPQLVFTDQTGRVLGKEDDLETHRSGRLRLSALEVLDTMTVDIPSAAVVSALVRLVGTFDGNTFSGKFRYTRTWFRSASGIWQVVAGHVSVVQ